jgi:hypothetical protein
MLGFITRYGSSKGMVAVPNLAGKTADEAIQIIRDTGLTFKQGTLRITSNVAFDKKVYLQNLAPDTLVDYESEISFSYDSYYGTTANVTYGPVEVYNTIPSEACSGTTLVRTRTFLNRRKVLFNGEDQGFYDEVASTTDGGTSEPNSAACGYVPPARVCPTSDVATSAWSACRQTPGTFTGTRTRSRLAIRSNCSEVPYTETGNCCIPNEGTWGAFIGGGGAQSRSRTDVIDADCNTRTVSETVCAQQCGSWKNVGTCVSKRQKQTRTCVKTTTNATTGLRECTSYSESRTISCTGGAV